MTDENFLRGMELRKALTLIRRAKDQLEDMLSVDSGMTVVSFPEVGLSRAARKQILTIALADVNAKLSTRQAEFDAL